MQEYDVFDVVSELAFIFLYVGVFVGYGLQQKGIYLGKKSKLESKLK